MAGMICPECGSKLRHVVFGYPDGKLFEAAERGEVALGGCCVPDRAPDGYCPSCRVTISGDPFSDRGEWG